MSAAGRAWLRELHGTLPRHADALQAMLRAVEAEPQWATFWLSCSVADGRGDELSDLDAALGWGDDGLPDDALVVAVIRAAGRVHDLLAHRLPGWTLDHRRYAVEYADGLQLDLVVLPAAERSYRVPAEVVLHDPGELLVGIKGWDPVAFDTAAEWLFLGWWALSDVAKYAVRESWLEAAERLSDVRLATCRLWAAAVNASHPQFGLGQLLDLPSPEASLPPRLRTLFALPTAESVLSALRAATAALEEARLQATDVIPQLTTPAIAEHVLARVQRISGASD